MTAFGKIATMMLRILQVVGAVIVVGLASKYLSSDHQTTEYHVRFIVTDVVAIISAFFGFIWLLPFSSNHMNYWVDGVLGTAFAGISGWLIYETQKVCGGPTDGRTSDSNGRTSDSNGHTSDANGRTSDSDNVASKCDKWQALYVFSVLCTVLWILTALIGCCWVRKDKKKSKSKAKR